MKIYADYYFYKNEYGGTLLPGADDLAADHKKEFRDASALIDQYTFGKAASLDPVPDYIKYCCCELAEASYTMSKLRDNAGKSSESVQGWSVSYVSAADADKELKLQSKEIIYKWLYNSGLLYSGVE